MRVSGARLSKRCGIKQAPARVVARASAYLPLSMKVRSLGPARSSGATSAIRCESRRASGHSAPVSEMMLATVKPEGRSKKRRFPMSQSLIGERLGNDAGHRNCAGDVCCQIVFPPLRRWRRTRFVQSGAEQAQIQIRKLGRTIALIIDRFHLVLVGRACAAPTLAQSFVQAMLQIGRDFGGLGVR